MAKREPLFEADLGDNGGLLRLWDDEDLERFIIEEQSFWRAIHEGDMSQPFHLVDQRMGDMGRRLRDAKANADKEGGNRWLLEYFGNQNTRVPLSTSQQAKGILHILETLGKESARGAIAAALPMGIWGEGVSSSSRPYWRGMVEQIVFENGLTPAAITAAKRTMNGLTGRSSQVLGKMQDLANEALAASADEFDQHIERQRGRAEELERRWVETLLRFGEEASQTSAQLKETHHAYLEQMKLKAPVKYWSDKAVAHKVAAGKLRNWVAGFFIVLILLYVGGLMILHQPFASFLLQFQGSTGALLVVSAVFALLASLPLWIGRLLVKFYLSEHHLATDAKERETMTQTYLALTAEGAVDENDRALILGALFRSTPDGVVKDNAQPDTSPAALLSKILDSR